MYFEQFEPYSVQQWQGGFIRSITHQMSDNSIHLLSCEFDTDSFSDQHFTLYGIDVPDDIKGAVVKRKAEFLAGRLIVKLALSALGLAVARQQVGIAHDRSPLWPKGFVGSISHTTDFAVCCVAKAAAGRLIGVDSELILSTAMAQNLAVNIHNETELTVLTDAGFSAALATSLIFSAKESLYKALYPLVCCFFGFEQACVQGVDLQSHSLTLSLCSTFASHYGLNTDHKIQFNVNEAMVYTLLMQ